MIIFKKYCFNNKMVTIVLSILNTTKYNDTLAILNTSTITCKQLYNNSPNSITNFFHLDKFILTHQTKR